MLLGYAYILLAAVFWGGSVVLGKHLIQEGHATALLLSQARATFAWLLLLGGLAVVRPRLLVIRPADLWRFVPLGVIGISGANFLLYFAIGGMDTAVADLIQFLAPALAALWMWWRGAETMERPKVIALLLSLVGCGLALGAFGRSWHAPPLYAGAAFASTLCYAFLLVWGKRLSSRYPTFTYLHYALLGATLFWAIVVPPWSFLTQLGNPTRAALLAGFGLISVLTPYSLFFLGLKRLPASRAGIASTFEPVFITLVAWAVLGEQLLPSQLAGIALVLAAIAILELKPPPAEKD